MKKLLPKFLILGIIVWLCQPCFATLQEWQTANAQSITAYEASYHPNYFDMNNQYQLDSMVQFKYFGNDSSYQYKICYENRTMGNQTIKQAIEYQWQNKWVEKAKQEYTYNAGGELMKSSAYLMDSVSNQWKETAQHSYTYQNGKKNSNIMQRMDSTSHSWKNAYKYEYAYNSNDSVTQQLMYCWNDTASEWQNCYKHEYFYNYLNCQDSSCQYQWDSVANEWIRQYKYEYRYNTDNQLAKQYQYCYDSVDCEWDSCACNLYEYENEYLYKHEYCTYDSVGNLWNYEWKHEYLYSADGQIKQLHRYKHSSLKSTASDWELDTKDFYFYAGEVTGIAISENILEQEIRIYPNPATEQLTLELGDAENCRLQIVDVSGKVLKQILLQSNKTVIPLTQFEPGAYFFIIDNGKNRTTNKVVVQ
nr:T9SS type A sorting domain-containing protein [uncultured Draconibacterium sp.]